MAEEHFVSHEERLRSPRLAHRGGRASSPTHSAHGNLLRHSILKISENKKAKKVRFFRNGDRFFPGMIYAVSPERFRTFESLMAELTNSPVCDKTVLPNGVRHVFSLDTMRKVTDLDELEEGENYVCASTDVFKRVDYTRSATPCWNVNTNVKGGESQTDGAASAVSREWNGGEMYHEDGRDFIRPKLITVVRNGSKPRKAVRVLLNRKTAHSFNQVLTYITEAIKLDSGAVRKLYTIGGQPVTSLIDFFGDDTVFVAYGHEKYAVDDFDLDENEVKFVSAYCRSGGDRPRDRITLRSPKSPRRTLTSSTRSIFGSKQGVSERRRNGEHSGSSSPLSPLSPKVRRARPGSSTPTPIKPRQTNGHSQEWTGPTAALSEHYEVGKVIGEGNFAVVRECVHRKTKDPYALKIIDKTKCKGKEQMIESEVRILRRVKHPNIILLVEEFDGPQELDLIMEFVKGGDLFDAIASATKYTERDACGMIYNLASALRYLHSLNIVHRDVKPENLLVCEHVDGSKSLKLGDFGLATVAEDVLYTVCGTPTYVAPEILEETGYGLKVDVWAAGIITYILLCGFPPFVSQLEDQEELFDRIMSGDFEFTSPFWDDVSQSAKELISSTLEVDPRQRYSAADVLQHPWVSDDTALDTDLHTGIRKELKSHFRQKPKSTSPGIALIASTALDKGSRYFQGRKGAQLTLQPSENGSSTGDEIF